jgi:uncharacterized protein (TIGR03437 family)
MSSPGRGAIIARSRVLLTLACALAGSASAQFVQQGGKLAGTGANGNAGQGRSVALSADGNAAIVGGPFDAAGAGCGPNFSPVPCPPLYAGAAWVYTRSGGVWTQQGNKLVPVNGGGDAGSSVALSADGNTAIVGGPAANPIWFDPHTPPVGFIGAAWIFTRSGAVWAQQGGALLASDAVRADFGNGAWEGQSVALSADGNTAIVGGPNDNNLAGAAWVFTRSGSAWTQQGAKLVGTGAVGNATQGSSVALSADGNTAIAGGPADNGGAGAAWVFTRSGGVWTQQGGKLIGAGAVGNATQGFSVALSADGSTALVGGWHDNNQTGAAWVYARSAGVWTQQGSKLAGAGAVGSATQGSSVALSADGNTALLGGWGDNNQTGAAWIYTRSAGVWSQHGGKLAGTGAVGNAEQGYSVALSGDGNTALLGGYGDNGSAGAAWVFAQSGSPSPPAIRAQDGVLNGASFASPIIAPGTFMSIFGTNLASTTASWDIVDNQLPTILGGTSVLVNGKNAYMVYVSPGQINFLAPAGYSSDEVPVQVITSGGASNPLSVPGSTMSPGLFMFSQGNFRYAISTLPDGAYAVPSGLLPAGANVRAAKPGDVLAFWATGLGPTTPQYPEGQVVTVQNRGILASPATVTIGGKNATVAWAGIVGAGLYQINAQVPDVPPGDNVVLVTVAGVPAQSGANIYVGN